MGASDNTRGLILAILSSLFIGTYFILKKKGLLRAAAAGTRAGNDCKRWAYWDAFLASLVSLSLLFMLLKSKLQLLYNKSGFWPHNQAISVIPRESQSDAIRRSYYDSMGSIKLEFRHSCDQMVDAQNERNKRLVRSSVSSITSEICGFITIISGTVILHMTREEEPATPTINVSLS